MCVFCNGFRNRIRGYEEIDNKIVNGKEISLGLEKNHAVVFLLVRLDSEVVESVPISYCPLCGKEIKEL